MNRFIIALAGVATLAMASAAFAADNGRGINNSRNSSYGYSDNSRDYTGEPFVNMSYRDANRAPEQRLAADNYDYFTRNGQGIATGSGLQNYNAIAPAAGGPIVTGGGAPRVPSPNEPSNPYLHTDPALRSDSSQRR